MDGGGLLGGRHGLLVLDFSFFVAGCWQQAAGSRLLAAGSGLGP